MTVLCGACNAENRDAAKFCKGCGRKIAQAWPQAAAVVADVGDAALLLANANQRMAARKSNAPEEELRPTQAPPRARISNGRWISALGLGVLLLVAAAAWWGQRNKSQEIAEPAAPAVEAGASQPTAVAPPVAVPLPVTPEPVISAPAEATVKSEPAPIAEAAALASSKPRKAAQKKQSTPAAPPVVEAAAPAPPPAVPEPVRAPTPQESCAGRNFIARAQCMAEQCARPAMASHPQCEAVRQQQRIEEEKRNPTMAG